MSAEPLCKPVTLAGQHVSLEPLSIVHCDDLRAATSDGEIWKLEYTIVPAPEGMMHEIRRRLALQHAGRMLPFAVRDLSRGCVVGMTTYMNLDASVQRVEIGSTWYARSAQRTAINTECKLLLLQHAFEVLDVIAVEFRTSSLNLPSRKAIERLGATYDGTLRNHMRMPNGTLRDTCVYSILPGEWPFVKAKLGAMLAPSDRSFELPPKATMSLPILPARTDADWHAAIALLKCVYVGDGYSTADGAAAFMRRDILEAGGTLLLAKASDGTVMGVVLMLRMDGDLVQVAQAGEAEFRVLAVAPEARGKGVGEALVQACKARAKASGARALVLWSQPTMPSAHRLYIRLGFVRVPERDVADARGFTRLVFRLGW